MKNFYVFLWVVIGTMLGALMSGFNVVKAEEVSEKVPEIYIKAINPGYTIDGVSNVGEMIEIARRDSDKMISLAGLTVGYTNSSGNYAVLAEFPENSYLVGESILLRLASSPGHELAALNYTKTLAFKAGPLALMRGEEVVDSACWLGSDGCMKEFKSANPTTLLRNLTTGEFEHVSSYEPQYEAESYYVETVADGDGQGEMVMNQCKGLIFSEMLSYYEESQNEQFIELYNASAEQILLDGCALRYKGKMYLLSGIIKPEKYEVKYLTDFKLTKNPTNVNSLELIDVNGEVIDTLNYYNGQRKGTAWALIGYDKKGEGVWRTTYAPTPGEPNNYQEFRTCEEGKVINEVTGNCVKVVTVEEKVCPVGQYLNPLTGRCRKIEIAEATTCKEGYELNEETGRCRKIKNNDGAEYSLVTEKFEEKNSFVALYLVLAVVGVGIVIVVFEFRKEILRLFGKVFRRFH